MRLLSLFSGGGGLDMAAELLWPDLQHVAFSEFDPHAASVYSRWRPDVPNLGDVTAIDWQTVGPVDVMTAGFPCQDISHAGKRAGIKEGTRSGLWYRVADAVRVLRPRLVLLENVAAIASPGGGLDVVVGSLAEVGFDAEWGVLRASDVGAPHGRARWFCVAWDPRHAAGGTELLVEHDLASGGARQPSEGRSHTGSQFGPWYGEAVAGDGVHAAGGSAETEPRRRGGAAAHAALDGRSEGRTGTGKRPGRAGLAPSHRGDAPYPTSDTRRVSDRNGGAPSDPGSERAGRDTRAVPRQATKSGRSGTDVRAAGHGGSAASADPDLAGGEARVDPRHDGQRIRVEPLGPSDPAAIWGDYTAAIRRWEAIIGRPAPNPLDGGERLSAPFVEWMMGWPQGHTAGIPRNPALKVLGNGVVPLQAAHAYRQLLNRIERTEVAA